MDKATAQLTKRIEDLESALKLMYDAYAVEAHFRSEAGLGDEEIELKQGHACAAVAELLPDHVAQYEPPEPEWFNPDDDASERQIAWYG